MLPLDVLTRVSDSVSDDLRDCRLDNLRIHMEDKKDVVVVEVVGSDVIDREREGLEVVCVY